MRLYNQLLLTRMPNLWLSGNKKELPIPAFNVQLQMSLAHCCKAECLRYTTSSSASTMINALGRYGRTKKSNKLTWKDGTVLKIELLHHRCAIIAPSSRHPSEPWSGAHPSRANGHVRPYSELLRASRTPAQGFYGGGAPLQHKDREGDAAECSLARL